MTAEVKYPCFGLSLLRKGDVIVRQRSTVKADRLRSEAVSDVKYVKWNIQITCNFCPFMASLVW